MNGSKLKLARESTKYVASLIKGDNIVGVYKVSVTITVISGEIPVLSESREV
jgi:hypothetical protein